MAGNDSSKNKNISQVIKQLDHDLKAPLGAIKAVATSLKEENKTQQDLINRSVERIEKLFSELKSDLSDES